MSWGKADLELIRLYEGLDGADARPRGKEEACGVVYCWSPLHSEAIAHDRRDAHLAAWQSIQLMSTTGDDAAIWTKCICLCTLGLVVVQNRDLWIGSLTTYPSYFRILFCTYWTQGWTNRATASSWLLTTAAAEVTYAKDHSMQISEQLLLSGMSGRFTPVVAIHLTQFAVTLEHQHA